MKISGLQKAIMLAGSQKKLAKMCGISQVAVAHWLKNNKVPAERIIEIETALKGSVTRKELRPDLYPD